MSIGCNHSLVLQLSYSADVLEFEEVAIQLAKKQHRSPEFAEVNPMKQVPAIVHGDLKLFERYPADARKRERIHSVLDLHHSNLRGGSVGYLLITHYSVSI